MLRRPRASAILFVWSRDPSWANPGGPGCTDVTTTTLTSPVNSPLNKKNECGECPLYYLPGVVGPRRGDRQRRQPAHLGINEVLGAEMEVVHVKVQSESFGRLSSVDVQGRFNRRRLTVSKAVYCTA